jgi:hypothetical protein
LTDLDCRSFGPIWWIIQQRTPRIRMSHECIHSSEDSAMMKTRCTMKNKAECEQMDESGGFLTPFAGPWSMAGHGGTWRDMAMAMATPGTLRQHVW